MISGTGLPAVAVQRLCNTIPCSERGTLPRGKTLVVQISMTSLIENHRSDGCSFHKDQSVSQDNPKNEDCMMLTMLLKYLNKFAISESLVPRD